jgi:hypothetical protein
MHLASRHLTSLAVALVLMLLPLAASAAEIIPITQCGQGILRDQIGTLSADLDCSAEPVAVNLNTKARLQLNGRRITAGQQGIRCFGAFRPAKCRVDGPGQIVGASISGISIETFDTKLDLRDLELLDNYVGILPNVDADVRLAGVAIQGGNSGMGIAGMAVANLRARDVTVTAVAFDAIQAVKARLNRVTVAGNGGIGLLSENLVHSFVAIRSSTFSDNGALYVPPSSLAGVDIASASRPRVSKVMCSRSFDLDLSPPFGSFGICAND